MILRRLAKIAAAKGIALDIGQMPEYSAATEGQPEADPQRPVRILAHAVARVADRFPVARKLSRHMEGTESRAGLGSDLVAEAIELYARNTEQIDRLLREYLAGTRDAAMSRRTARQATKTQNGGKAHATR